VARQEGIELGLAVLECLARPNVPMTRDTIAAATGMTKQAVERCEQRALKRCRILASHLTRESFR